VKTRAFSVCLILVAIPAHSFTSCFSLGNLKFQFVWITDTQFYSASHPEILQSIVSYINNQNFSYVIATGDLVDAWCNDTQWQNFNSSWSQLKIESDVVAGNHDNYGGANWTYYDRYFPNKRYYYLIKANWLLIFISWGLIYPVVNSTVQEWLKSIIEAYPEYNVIISTHYYAHRSGSYDTNLHNILKDFNKTFIVLNGHDLQDNGFVNVTKNNVIGVIHNYQNYKPGNPEFNGGNGYLVIVNVYENILHMKIYSVIEGFDGEGKGYPYELTIQINKDKEIPITTTTIVILTVTVAMIAVIKAEPRISKEKASYTKT